MELGSGLVHHVRSRIYDLFSPALSTNDLQECIRDLLAVPDLTKHERDWLEADLQALAYVDHELWLLPDVNERICETVLAHIELVINRLKTDPGNG